MEQKNNTKCGFVGLIGAPNAGKSTLTNQLVGAKVSIVTPKVQTTRSRVMGIAMHNSTQIVLIDTPGIFKPNRRLEKSMVAAAWQGARDSDIIALLVDVSGRVAINEETRDILESLQKSKPTNLILILNKIDLIHRDRLLELSKELNETDLFKSTYMISALKGHGVEKLLEDFSEQLPESPWLFDEDQISDMPNRLLAAEITREKLFLQLQEELPYSCAVETTEWEDFRNGDIKISQTIYVMRSSQKSIVLGENGKRIKAIGMASRLELEKLLECKVHTKIFVKVREKWIDDPNRYTEWGLDFNS